MLKLLLFPPSAITEICEQGITVILIFRLPLSILVSLTLQTIHFASDPLLATGLFTVKSTSTLCHLLREKIETCIPVVLQLNVPKL